MCVCVCVCVCCPDLRGTAPAPLVPTSHHRPPHQGGVIPHRGPTPSGPQEVTSDRWWTTTRRRHCTAAESLRWCSAVVPVLIKHYAGHHLLCPLLTTMLAKSPRSQTEWASPPPPPTQSRPPLRPSTPLMWTLWCWYQGFDQNCLRQGRRKEHRDCGHHECMAWKATEAETLISNFY